MRSVQGISQFQLVKKQVYILYRTYYENENCEINQVIKYMYVHIITSVIFERGRRRTLHTIRVIYT